MFHGGSSFVVGRQSFKFYLYVGNPRLAHQNGFIRQLMSVLLPHSALNYISRMAWMDFSQA